MGPATLYGTLDRLVDGELIKETTDRSPRADGERRRYYESRVPVVEVDSTYYALPGKKIAETWVARTPDDFVFDVKAHALMTGQPTEVSRLPGAIKDELPEELKSKKRIYRKDMPAELLDAVYTQFRDAVTPLVDAGKLGAVFVQFPKWVFPSHEARELILDTRERLGLPIAVEFRHGSWFNEKNAERTLRFLSDNEIPYVMVDEPQGTKSSVPPITTAAIASSSYNWPWVELPVVVRAISITAAIPQHSPART